MTVGITGGLPEPIGFLPGSLLLDRDWLSGQVRDTGAFYGCREPRVSTTLWWYSASAVLFGPAIHELVLLGAGLSLDPAALRMTARPSGLERVVPGRPLDPGPAAFGRHLDAALAPVIRALGDVGQVTPQSLWAVAADSLATRLLTSRAPDPAGWAADIAGASERLSPTPRFVQVQGRPGAAPSTYVHRVSCCQIYRVPMSLCLSCPRRPPAERRQRLETHAAARAPGS
ncbi:(2Fe-2S)-binding protein [Kineosporia sp. NBRC 101731]|uniref:(2Fe-2S)-binding protein n=1 Tax=Kineosporia sp. NBRC 101731 TaxID=3032199 RepID=UPI0024A253F9|nr:(2Fe-2S)-binding protein [Kineosporia sp. NBRC 101731]GLY31702.1 Fe-S oxidoreductase [Kineosporia sp. NBRC 101731]